ncbi:MAG: Jag N-terminal domain-containing protein [Humidesulfovibrio sp.]|uniref:protein jag n=1 Tax=Humidesulfovibrio sp. TaxID=2910988 RepID=UPI002732A035|nr:protein jag [Humidesulfovibrio sp.]MDP2849377.1 Jag N-terminal domain-containing protein [Humidesulfovibrio sp.]
MSETKEFQGKNLDEAFEAACKHFDLKRDKLEIEIVSGGSSGIFGLVGVKKAIVRAKPRGSFKTQPEAAPERTERRPEPAERAEPTEQAAQPERSERPERAERPAPQPRREAERAAPSAERAPRAEAEGEGATANTDSQTEQPQGEQARRSERSRRGRGRGRNERGGERSADKPAERSADKPADKAGDVDGNRAPAPRRRERGPRREAEGNRAPAPRSEAMHNAPHDDEDNGAPQGIAHLDQAKLEEVAREVTGKLLEPLVENAKVNVELLADRVCVRIEDPENSGLLIGREGQTLASIQYLVNRLVSKRMDASVRVQIDAGDYRENQDERLRQIARHLADKAMASGRTQSTRPMSSYHRRVVHLTLQDDEHVFTRSKGEGSMKRVLIMTKRKGKNGEMVNEIPQDAARQFDDDPRD